jgi:hypothetical protein
MAGTSRRARPFLCEEELSMAEDRIRPDIRPTHPGAPRQALSGGGSETHAGSDEGGSAYGDDREDVAEPQTSEGGFKDAAAAHAPPEPADAASTESVNNTGEPRPVLNGEGDEGQPGDDVDAATG